MVNDTICFQMRDINRTTWNQLINNIDRRVLNRNKEWESRNLEDYFKLLVLKISQLSKEDINKIVDLETKIKLENKKV